MLFLVMIKTQDVSNNKLTSLPNSIGNLRGLKTLNVSHNNLTELPYTVGLLKKARMLDCTHNSLKEIPEEVGDMASLEQLYLRHNHITGLPVMRVSSSLKVRGMWGLSLVVVGNMVTIMILMMTIDLQRFIKLCAGET